jgi:hypothetical protein
MKRRKIFFTTLILLMILYGCNEKDIKSKIMDKINNNCNQAKCIINLKDVTEFKW